MPVPVRTLFAHIVDYAGTFPPASLAVDDAVSAYARERAGPDAWLLGRFVVGAQSLDAVEDAVRGAFHGEWALSVIAGPDARAALARVNAFNARWAGRASIASVEFAPAPPAEIAGLMRLTGDTTEAFFETPLDADLEARLDAISAAGGAAKVRTGGTTPAAIPSPAALADFLFECAQRGLPFKATAGLHHAVRSCYPLTYERDSSTAVMHGFLNALAAAAMARRGRISSGPRRSARRTIGNGIDGTRHAFTILRRRGVSSVRSARARFANRPMSWRASPGVDLKVGTTNVMAALNETHDPARRSWVESANSATTDFPIQNLPLGVFRAAGGAGAPTIGVAIGDQILDLRKSAELGLLNGLPEALRAAATDSTLNRLMARGHRGHVEAAAACQQNACGRQPRCRPARACPVGRCRT